MIGETAMTNIKVENTLALSLTSNKSRTIALDATMPTQPPSAWKNLNNIKVSTDIAVAQVNEEIAYKLNPKYKGFFRPNRSNKGPYNNWPIEIPIKKEDNESVTVATEVFNPVAIEGNAGKYMSIDKGPMADINPKIKIR